MKYYFKKNKDENTNRSRLHERLNSPLPLTWREMSYYFTIKSLEDMKYSTQRFKRQNIAFLPINYQKYSPDPDLNLTLNYVQ